MRSTRGRDILRVCRSGSLALGKCISTISDNGKEALEFYHARQGLNERILFLAIPRWRCCGRSARDVNGNHGPYSTIIALGRMY